jgi:capsular exopolysaccharide synthesis family protein
MTTAQDTPPSEHLGAPTPPSLLQILWNRKAIILLGGVVGLVVGALYFVQRQPVYESTAQVLVKKETPPVPGLGVEGYAMFDDYLATHEKLVGSPVLIEKAVQIGELDRLKSFAGQNNPAPAIRGALKINRESAQGGSGYGGPSILNLSFRCGDADDCAAVLDAVIRSYQVYLEDDYQSKNSNTIKKMLPLLHDLDAKLDAAHEADKKLHAETPLVIGKDGVTDNEERLVGIRSRLSVLGLRRLELEARQEAVGEAVKRGRDPRRLIDAVAKDPNKPGGDPAGPMSDAQLALQLAPLRVELRNKELVHGKDHPEVRMLRNSIEVMEEMIKSAQQAKKTAPVEKPVGNLLLDAGVDAVGLLAGPANQGPLLAAGSSFANRTATREVAAYVQDLADQLEAIKIEEAKLLAAKEREEKVVRGLDDFRFKEKKLHQQITDLEDTKKPIAALLGQKNAGVDMGGFEAKVIAKPGRGYQVEPKPAPIFTTALLLGLAAGLALAWVAEATDKSFRTPDEVRRRLRLPVVGHVPRITPKADAVREHDAGALPLDPSICAYYQSKSIEAEAFRGIRTTLYFSTQNQNCTIIQVTSPNMGDGKTTLATNLAVSIAQSGKKILLIDADFRRPRLHRMFGLAAKVGLASVIQDEAELLDAVQPTAVPNLSVLPCGPRPHNPAELLTSARFKEILEVLRERYDLILVDTPPLLAVSDPSVVASQVDGVLLTIRVSKNGRPAAERARDILATLEVNVLGVVVNGIGRRGEEGYGATNYGYHYQYQYAYEPTDNHSYYQDSGDPDSQVHKNGRHSDANGAGEPPDPDAADLGAVPPKPAPPRQRERVPGTGRRKSEGRGVVAGLRAWLRSTLWH